MRKNLSFFFLWLSVFVSSELWAQNTAIVQGYVTDSVSREPIPYATIQLQNAEGTLINGAITDVNGRFLMKEVPLGTQTFIVSFVGYRTKKVTKEIKEKELWIGIGIVLENKQLHEVSVVGEKVLMKEEVDKTVYRLDDFVLRNSPTVLEAMKAIPGVTVKPADESIRVNGSRNVLVLVDGVYSSKSLSSINPEDVESVEVITNPSVEYDSEVANVVNVILKEERKQGIRVVAMGRGGIPFDGAYGRLNVDYEFSRFRVFGNYRVTYYKLRPETYLYDSTCSTTLDVEGNHYDETISTHFHPSKPTMSHNAGLGFDYRISKNDLLSMSGNLSTNKYEIGSQQLAFYSENGHPEYQEWNHILSEGRSREQNYTLFYRHRFAKKGHELTLNTNYYTMAGGQSYLSNSTFLYPDSDTTEKTLNRLNDNRQSAWNAKLKYDLPITEKLKLTAGLQNYSRWIYYCFNDSNDNQYFDYHDSRLAGFAQASYRFSDKVSLSAGLRAENLRFHIYDTISRSQWHGLPSVAFMYRINESNTLKINYKSLLEYPSYHFLSPFVYTQNDALVFSAGNPYLLPEKTHRVGLNYAFRKNYTNLVVEPYWAFRKDIIGQQYAVEGVAIHQLYDNVAQSVKYGGHVAATTLVGGFLMPMVELDLGYVDYGNPLYNGMELSLAAGLEMELPWDLTLDAEFIYQGTSRRYNGYEYGSPLLEAISLSRGFFSDRLYVELSMEQFFLNEKTEEVVKVPNYCSTTRSEIRTPSVNLFVRYVFSGGSKKIAKQEERESLMESEENAAKRK